MRTRTFLTVCLAFGISTGAVVNRAQAQQLGAPTVLILDERNGVNYNEDTFDVTKFATSSSIVPVSKMPAWISGTGFTDIYALNGQPVGGLHSFRFTKFGLSTQTLTPGTAIADVARLSIIVHGWEIQDARGVAIGTIMAQGYANGPVPPGSPAAYTTSNLTIVGGTGAFAGVRGTVGGTNLPIGIASVTQRQASVVEDPAYRRVNGGGNARWVLTIYPGESAQVVSISHANGNQVRDADPAAPGETLTLVASGLGPTLPSLDPGVAFPASPLAVVNSPVGVLVNGRAAQMTAAVGNPGSVNQYVAQFTVPADVTRGQVSVQLTSAWIVGPGVYISVR